MAKEKEKNDDSVLGWIKDIAIVVGVTFVVLQFIRPTIVRQNSMEPNFSDGDYLIISRQSYKLFRGEPERGDVVVFDSGQELTDGSEKYLIKRVIGLPGETLTIKDGIVYADGRVLDASYTADGTTSGDVEDYVVPDDCYFCMGDNRNNSGDSRDPSIGPVPADAIIGKVVIRLWPFSSIGTIENPFK